MVNAHGQAASIRSAQESEVFDLAGQNATTIQQTVRTAFSEPLEIDQMIRITLITGAGKNSRQKYDSDAAKSVTSVLMKLGYEEDRGASGTLDCAGKFKLQHDTGKNLKTVVIYPRINETKDNILEEDHVESLIPVNSPDYKIAMSNINTFRNIITNKCPTWADKKGCLACVENLQSMMNELDGKLCKGAVLEASEQDFYDNVTDLSEKQTYLKNEIQKQVFEQGKITEKEKEILLTMASDKMATLKKEHKSTIKNLQRKEALLEIDPIPPYPLKHENEIRKLVKDKLAPIETLEQKTKGRLLTLKETQMIAQKDELLDLIHQYELSSRGWFEDDDTFQSRLLHSREQRKTTKHKKVKSSTISSIPIKSSSSPAVTKWILPTSTKTKSVKAKKSKLRGADVFTAMLMDSSDEEEEEPLEEPKLEVITKKASTKQNKKSDPKKQSKKIEEKITNDKEPDTLADVAPSAEITVKKKKKKSKKKHKKELTEPESSIQVTPEKVQENQVAEKSDASHVMIVILTTVYEILRDYVIPVILTILAWIIGKLFGTGKKKVKKR